MDDGVTSKKIKSQLNTGNRVNVKVRTGFSHQTKTAKFCLSILVSRCIKGPIFSKTIDTLIFIKN